ncbi:MAG: hypothetical protein COW65_08565 [Cytophagales bacterium CG18_big_fil_WC_8_21_14_2_50_42_9]|nr:MAG: hypothetical protein COW65_08565 [Cytophagales bacterium CG18_big_fil_WC_8_21_14_2_50_42_9]
MFKMKIKLFSILLLCSVFVVKSFAQESDGVKNVHSVKLSYLSLGYSYEHAITKQAVINSEIKLLYGFGANTIISSSRVNYYALIPLIRLEPRYYYNFLKRTNKGK